MSNSSTPSNPRLEEILHTLIEHRKLWLVPGLAALAMSWFYVYFVRAETYTARQSLIVRDDLLGQSLKPGQFESLDLMKSAQETILEIARKPQVIRRAMQKIGPANPGFFGVGADWPSDKIIEEVQESISFSAPNGAEFGHTEVIVLSSKSSSRERAREFILSLLDEIDVTIGEVRDLRLKSMQNELTQIRDSAQSSLSASAEKLREIEQHVGPDLSTLRGLSDQQSGGGTLAQQLLEIRSEKRQAGNELDSAHNQHETLVAAKDDPNAILAASEELYKFQPTLGQLKQELIKAQSAYAASVGRYEHAHPIVQSALEEVRSMHGQIHAELDSAKRALDSRIEVLSNKFEKLASQESAIETKFNDLSSLRVDYLRLDEEVKKKAEVFNDAQGHLASIQRLDSTGSRVNLLTRVDQPQVSTRADGLGKTTTILGGGLAGLLAGFGIVLLLAPGPDQDLTPRSTSPTPKPPVAPERPKTPVIPQTDVRDDGLSNVSSGSSPISASLQAAAPVPVATAVAAAAPKQEVPSPEPVAMKVDLADTSVSKESEPTPTDSQTTEVPVAAETSQPAIAELPVQAEQKDATDQNTSRGTGDSSGVPTAASILAELTRLRPESGGTNVLKPQQAASSDSTKTPRESAEPISAIVLSPVEEESNASAASEAAVDIRRRPASARPVDIVRQAEANDQEASTSYVSLEPNADSVRVELEPTDPPQVTLPGSLDSNPPARSANPFLRKSEGSKPVPPMVPKAEIVDEHTVEPVKPAPTKEDEALAVRQPASTVPIPDQIRELTKSISAFAKPITRPTNPDQKKEF